MFYHLQAFDSRLFALGGAQSHRFVPVKVADSHQTSFHQQQQQNVVQKQARPPFLPSSHSQGAVLTSYLLCMGHTAIWRSQLAMNIKCCCKEQEQSLALQLQGLKQELV